MQFDPSRDYDGGRARTVQSVKRSTINRPNTNINRRLRVTVHHTRLILLIFLTIVFQEIQIQS